MPKGLINLWPLGVIHDSPQSVSGFVRLTGWHLITWTTTTTWTITSIGTVLLTFRRTTLTFTGFTVATSPMNVRNFDLSLKAKWKELYEQPVQYGQQSAH